MNEITLELLRYLPGLLQTLGWSLVLWAWWSMKRIFVRQEECEVCRAGFDGRIEALAAQQRSSEAAKKALEQGLKALPTSQDIQALALSLKEIEGDIKGLAQKVNGQARATERMEKAVDLLTEVHMGNKG
jgi:hypothetical protein